MAFIILKFLLSNGLKINFEIPQIFYRLRLARLALWVWSRLAELASSVQITVGMLWHVQLAKHLLQRHGISARQCQVVSAIALNINTALFINIKVDMGRHLLVKAKCQC